MNNVGMSYFTNDAVKHEWVHDNDDSTRWCTWSYASRTYRVVAHPIYTACDAMRRAERLPAQYGCTLYDPRPPLSGAEDCGDFIGGLSYIEATGRAGGARCTRGLGAGALWDSATQMIRPLEFTLLTSYRNTCHYRNA